MRGSRTPVKNGDQLYYHTDCVGIECRECGMVFGVPAVWRDRKCIDKSPLWCPNGHRLSYTESELDRVKRERDQLKQREAMYLDEQRRLTAERDKAEAARATAERKSAKIAKRIAHGVCPGCNRTFANVARHMATKHGMSCEVVPAVTH